MNWRFSSDKFSVFVDMGTRLENNPETLETTLRDVFGFSQFRAGQKEAIQAFEAGCDVQVLMPTGGGKSICFQLPAVRASRPIVVVSPLIALMDDQVHALQQRDIPSVAMHTGKDWDTVKADRQTALDAKLIYVSPERMKAKRFRQWLKRLRPCGFAIDEAHCISEWGHDFRPAYMELSCIKEEFDCPIMALTATATRTVLSEIETSLLLHNPKKVFHGFERENLHFSVELVRGDKARIARARVLLNRTLGTGRAIVYAATRKRVKAVASALTVMGISADYYHAGRTAGARSRAQRRFEKGAVQVLVATNAFGMGVDLPDIRHVIHVEAPGTLEGYYQEAGRAGRDGKHAWSTLLYSPKDALTRSRLMGASPPPGAQEGWRALCDFVYGTTCRQAALVTHFTGDPTPPCGHCDVCDNAEGVRTAVTQARGELRQRKAERVAKQAREDSVALDTQQLDHVRHFVEQLKKPLGKRLIAQGLRGSAAKAVKRKGLAKNDFYGVLRGIPEVAIIKGIEALMDAGQLVPKGKKYPTVWVPDKPVRQRSATPSSRPKGPVGLAKTLKNFRLREARRRRVKAYQVFNNATLQGIVEQRPATMDDLLAVKGMGPARIKKYGVALLELVAQDASGS